MQNVHEFNFIAESVNDHDADMFMGPFEPTDGPVIRFPESWTMAHIMQAAGIFKSVTEAKKNGWDKPIDRGFQHQVVTKRKIHIWILNKLESA
jgi:hypothetical protein